MSEEGGRKEGQGDPTGLRNLSKALAQHNERRPRSSETPLLPSGETDEQPPTSIGFIPEKSGLPEQEGWWKRNWKTVAGLAATIGCSTTLILGLATSTIQEMITKLFGTRGEFFQKQKDVRQSGEELAEEFVKKAQKQGTDFGEDFKMDDAKEQGANLAERAHLDSSRVFDAENTGSKADIILTGLVTQDPLGVEPGPKSGKDAIFNQQTWSIGQKIFMDMIGSSAQEYGIDPNNGGLEKWLVANNKDNVYQVTINGQQVNVSASHLLQILWNEYKSGDAAPITAQDQELLKAYWQASGRRWSAVENRAERQRLSWDDVRNIFEMARENGMNGGEILGAGFTLAAELAVSPARAEIKALDMAQAGLGISTFDSLTGTFLGFMMVIGFSRRRFANILNFDEIKLKGQELLDRLKTSPEIVEEIRAKDNSQKLVNRIRHGLSLSREVIMGDLGAVLLDPANQDMQDLIATEGPSWFRYLPEDHPEINYIMNFFGCRTYQELQDLAGHPETIADRLEQRLTFKTEKIDFRGQGKRRFERDHRVRSVITDQQRRLIELYRLTGH